MLCIASLTIVISFLLCCQEVGDLFLWGSNRHGQLTSGESFLPKPVLLDHTLLDRERVTDIWSGWTHLVAKTGEITKMILQMYFISEMIVFFENVVHRRVY